MYKLLSVFLLSMCLADVNYLYSSGKHILTFSDAKPRFAFIITTSDIVVKQGNKSGQLKSEDLKTLIQYLGQLALDNKQITDISLFFKYEGNK